MKSAIRAHSAKGQRTSVPHVLQASTFSATRAFRHARLQKQPRSTAITRLTSASHVILHAMPVLAKQLTNVLLVQMPPARSTI